MSRTDYIVAKFGSLTALDEAHQRLTDYGHADTSAQIEALRILKKEGKVDKTVIDRILDANARALYGLN